MSSEYKAGKLLGYQLLCTVTLRRHDVPLSMEHLLRFYISLHHGLTSDDQVSTHSVFTSHIKLILDCPSTLYKKSVHAS